MYITIINISHQKIGSSYLTTANLSLFVLYVPGKKQKIILYKKDNFLLFIL